MKKVLFVAVLALAGLTSCKKDWSCECQINSGGATVTQPYPIADASKADAKTACDAYQTQANLVGSTISCNLK